MVKETVILEAIFVDKCSKVMKTVRTSLEHLNNGFDKTTSVMSTTNKQGEITTQTMTKLTPTIRRFKMEWLSVMFAGMALQRVFSGVIKSQMDLWGVTSTLSSMWTVTMIPVMEKVSEKLTDIMLKIMDLPEDTQMAIGFTVLGISALGTILSTIGQITLGVLGLKMVFANFSLGAFFTTIKLWFASLSGAILGIAAIIVAIIVGMVVAWKENFMGMKLIVKDLVNSLKTILSGIVDIFKGIFQLIIGILTGNVDKIKEGFVNILKGVANLFIGIINLLMSAIMAITVGVVRVVAGIIQGVINIILGIVNAVSKLLGGKGSIQKVDLVGWLSKLDATPPQIPSFKEGGVMPYTGLAQLHAGERIIPNGESGSTTYAPNITVNASVSNDYDVRKLADEINKYMLNNYNNSTKRRS
jgi:hypothetical protein